MPEEENDDGSKEDDDPTKMYSTSEKRFDEPTSVVEEPTKEINLGIGDDSRTVIISLNLNSEEESALIQVLKEYKDTFAWTYEDMLGLDLSGTPTSDQARGKSRKAKASMTTS